MRERLLAAYFAVATMAIFPLSALAASNSTGDDKAPVDARLDGFDKGIALDAGSTALTWLLMIVLGIVCVAVMFKDAKRTHLD